VQEYAEARDRSLFIKSQNPVRAQPDNHLEGVVPRHAHLLADLRNVGDLPSRAIGGAVVSLKRGNTTPQAHMGRAESLTAVWRNSAGLIARMTVRISLRQSGPHHSGITFSSSRQTLLETGEPIGSGIVPSASKVPCKRRTVVVCRDTVRWGEDSDIGVLGRKRRFGRVCQRGIGHVGWL